MAKSMEHLQLATKEAIQNSGGRACTRFNSKSSIKTAGNSRYAGKYEGMRYSYVLRHVHSQLSLRIIRGLSMGQASWPQYSMGQASA